MNVKNIQLFFSKAEYMYELKTSNFMNYEFSPKSWIYNLIIGMHHDVHIPIKKQNLETIVYPQ